MRKCLRSKDIPKEVKVLLPAIDKETYKERACSFCHYFAGYHEKKHRCMMKICSWDTEEEQFHPVLLQLRGRIEREVKKAEEKVNVARERQEALESMFERELKEQELRADPCYECPYAKSGPCIGICYKKLLD